MKSWATRSLFAVAGFIAASIPIGLGATPPAGAASYVPGLGTTPGYCASADPNGGKPLGPNLNNVYACGPVPINSVPYDSGPYIPTFWPLSGSSGGFQCTELAQRYLYVVTQGDLAKFTGENGNPWGGLSGEGFAAAVSQKYGLPLMNSTSGAIPHVGDIISEAYSQSNRYRNVGDVGVVTGVTSTTISIMAENNNAQGTNTIYMNSPTNWVINPRSNYQYSYFEWVTPPGAGNSIPANPSVGVWPNGLPGHGPGQQDVFWKGADANLWEAVWNNGWHGPSRIGMGPLGSAPSVVTNPARNEDDVFWKGTDNNLWEAYWSYGSGWHGPNDLGMGPLGSAPSVTVWPNGQQDVFWKGADNSLWEAVWNNGWHGPYRIGMGPLGSLPTVVANPARSEEDVYWKGADGNLWSAVWSYSSSWPGWHGPFFDGMGPLGSAPSVTVWPNGQQDVFWKGADSNLWEAVWNNGWHGPYGIGMGPLGSQPTVVANPTRSEEDAYWKGADGNLWSAVWSYSSSWPGWHGPFFDGMGPLG